MPYEIGTVLSKVSFDVLLIVQEIVLKKFGL